MFWLGRTFPNCNCEFILPITSNYFSRSSLERFSLLTFWLFYCPFNLPIMIYHSIQPSLYSLSVSLNDSYPLFLSISFSFLLPLSLSLSLSFYLFLSTFFFPSISFLLSLSFYLFLSTSFFPSISFFLPLFLSISTSLFLFPSTSLSLSTSLLLSKPCRVRHQQLLVVVALLLVSLRSTFRRNRRIFIRVLRSAKRPLLLGVVEKVSLVAYLIGLAFTETNFFEPKKVII